MNLQNLSQDEPAGDSLDSVRTLSGTVVRLFHQSATFCAGTLKPAASDTSAAREVKFAGKAFAAPGEHVTFVGKYERHERFGQQFKTTDRSFTTQVTPQSLAAWLSVNLKAHGIGPVRAQKIANEFGIGFVEQLQSNPEAIATAINVPLQSILDLATAWEATENLNLVGTELAQFELTYSQIRKLFAKFKRSIVPILRTNPYMLIGEIDGFGFKRIDAIAAKIGIAPDHSGRVDAAICHAIDRAEDSGSTCIERELLVAEAVKLLGEHTPGNVSDLVQTRLDVLVAERDVREVSAGVQAYLALPHTYHYERSIGIFLKNAQNPNIFFAPDEIPPLIAKHCQHLDSSQRQAVEMALRHQICLISGQAGAGKSFLTATIVEIYRAIGRECVLAAPTGKAARRLEELVPNATASTIHRLLGWQGHAFLLDSQNPLKAEVLAIDEVSMLDTPLSYRLFDAITPETAVILIGDHQQLPPVGPGALLRDAIEHSLLPLTILSQCHRQAGILHRNAHGVLSGDVAPTHVVPSGERGPWYVNRQLHLPESVLRYIERLYTDVLVGQLGFNPDTDIQFLTACHNGPLGTRAINALCQRIHQRRLGRDIGMQDMDARLPIYEGDRVIQTKNDYHLELMNGHQGIVVNRHPLTVQFGERVVTIPQDGVGNIELAYCLTPHKLQGSQCPCAVIIVHKTNSFMQHRNWLYTAVTRAQQTCVILGDPDGIRRAAERVVTNERKTLLGLLSQEGIA